MTHGCSTSPLYFCPKRHAGMLKAYGSLQGQRRSPRHCTASPYIAVRIYRTIQRVNPFDYQSPVGASRLIDRRAELDELQHAASNRTAIRLAAPRRFGKTT